MGILNLLCPKRSAAFFHPARCRRGASDFIIRLLFQPIGATVAPAYESPGIVIAP